MRKAYAGVGVAAAETEAATEAAEIAVATAEVVEVGAEVEDDGSGGRVRIILEINLGKEVLGAAEDVKHSPEGGS